MDKAFPLDRVSTVDRLTREHYWTELYRAGGLTFEEWAVAVHPRPWAGYSPCTCHLGVCLRGSHRPARAQCGHYGVFGHTTRFTYCYRPECEESARIAGAMLSLARSAAR